MKKKKKFLYEFLCWFYETYGYSQPVGKFEMKQAIKLFLEERTTT